MEKYIHFIGVFVFIFSILYIIKYILKAVNVIRMEQGKIDNDTIDLIILGSALSYILTFLIC